MYKNEILKIFFNDINTLKHKRNKELSYNKK